MDTALQTHIPSKAVKTRAEAAEIDLEALKRNDPQRYKMMNAVSAVSVDTRLVQEAAAVFLAAFPRYEVFRLESDPHTQLLAFPPLSEAEQNKFDDALARLSAHPKYASQHAYFRVITDNSGEHRQFALPVAAQDWQGELGVLIGPFASEAKLNSWKDAKISGALMTDALPRDEVWFCDVFKHP